MSATIAEKEIAMTAVKILFDHGFADAHSAGQDVEKWFRTENLKDCGFCLCCGATKAVFMFNGLDNWVIKINLFDEKQFDWCGREYDVYLSAKDCGLERFFAEVEPLFSLGRMKFFLQQCVRCDGSVDDEIYETMLEDEAYAGLPEDEVWDKLDEMDEYDRIAYLYGSDDLLDFLNRHEVNDLHRDNFGYDGTQYILTDYSGFVE